MHLLESIKVSLHKLRNKDDPYVQLSPRPYVPSSSPLLFQGPTITTNDSQQTIQGVSSGAESRHSRATRIPSSCISILTKLLDERWEAASKLEKHSLSASPIVSTQMHRDLVGWSMIMKSAERESKIILESLKADGLTLEEVLGEVKKTRDVAVINQLWNA